MLLLIKDSLALNYQNALSPSAGDCWYHIPSPAKQKLKQVSVGRTSVYTVDENGKDTASVFTAKPSEQLDCTECLLYAFSAHV